MRGATATTAGVASLMAGAAGVPRLDSNTQSIQAGEVAGAAHADAWLLKQLGSEYASSCGRTNRVAHHQTLRAAQGAAR